MKDTQSQTHETKNTQRIKLGHLIPIQCARSGRVFSAFGSLSALKYNYCSLSNKRLRLSIKLFFFYIFFFLFNIYQTDIVASFSHSFPSTDIKASCPLHPWLFHIPLIILPVQLAELRQISKQSKIRLESCPVELQSCAASRVLLCLSPSFTYLLSFPETFPIADKSAL